jgi:hypothetical protein
VITVIAGFIYGCFVTGFVTALWAVKVAPHNGQGGLAVLLFGLMGGVAGAVVTLLFVFRMHLAVKPQRPVYPSKAHIND